MLWLLLCRWTIFLFFVTAGYRSDARRRNINSRADNGRPHFDGSSNHCYGSICHGHNGTARN